MKNRKKNTGMIPVVTAVMILLAAMGLFPSETVLAAGQTKAVTSFHAESQLSEAHKEYASKKSAAIPDPVWTARFYRTGNPGEIPDPVWTARFYRAENPAGIPDPVWTARFYGTENPAGIPNPAGKAVKLPKIGILHIKLPKIGIPHIKLPKIGIPHIELPEIDFSKLDKEAEKEKLREALKEMDHLGISPKMLLHRAWDLLVPGEAGKKTGEKADSQDAEPVTERVKKKASEEFDKAVDQAAEKVKEKASEELDKAVEQAIGKGKE